MEATHQAQLGRDSEKRRHPGARRPPTATPPAPTRRPRSTGAAAESKVQRARRDRRLHATRTDSGPKLNRGPAPAHQSPLSLEQEALLAPWPRAGPQARSHRIRSGTLFRQEQGQGRNLQSCSESLADSLAGPLAVPRKVSRGDRIRTCDLMLPKHPRYQAALRPDGWELRPRLPPADGAAASCRRAVGRG